MAMCDCCGQDSDDLGRDPEKLARLVRMLIAQRAALETRLAVTEAERDEILRQRDALLERLRAVIRSPETPT